MGEDLPTTDRPEQPAPDSTPAPKRGLHPALAGLIGGHLAGVAAGALGGGIAAILADVGIPDEGHILHAAALGGAVFGVAAGAAGAPVGLLAAKRGPRAPLARAFAATFGASLVGAAEVEQGAYAGAARTLVLGTALLAGLIALAFWLVPRLWKLRWLFLAWLLVCVAGEAYSRSHPKSFTPTTAKPDGPVAQLGYAPLPTVLGRVAVHYYFVTFDPDEGRWHRWDLWQYANEGGTSWGHVHRDLLAPEAGVGGDPACLEHEWRGDEARAVLRALARSEEYPYRDRYLAWPGPNSNTYPAWVLREAGVSADLDPRAIGRAYHGGAGAGRTTTRTGVSAETAVVGATVGLEDGVELHFLGFTFGVDVWPPATKTPFGRLGFDE